MLYARTADQRTATFSKTLGLGADYLRETRALLLRINLMRADFVVKGSSEAHGPSKFGGKRVAWKAPPIGLAADLRSPRAELPEGLEVRRFVRRASRQL